MLDASIQHFSTPYHHVLDSDPVLRREHEELDAHSCSDVAAAHYTMASSAIKTARAYLFKDEPSRIEWMGKFVSTLDFLVSSASAAIRFIAYLAIYYGDKVLSNVLPALHKLILVPTAIAGLVFSVFETVYEVYHLIKIASLRSKLTFIPTPTAEHLADDATLRKVVEIQKKNLDIIESKYLKLYPHQVNRVRTYVSEVLHISEPLQSRNTFNAIAEKARKIKSDNLARHLSPKLADDIKENLLLTRHSLEHPNLDVQKKALATALCLLQDIDTQTRKKLVIHVTGLLSIITSVVGYALLLAVPGLGPVLLGLAIVSILFTVMRYLLDKGTFNQRGWSFSVEDCLPKRLAKLFFNKEAGLKPAHEDFNSGIAKLRTLSR